MNFTSKSDANASLYHCPCGSATEASTSYHTLPSLYFCEECDSIRCPLCVLEEVTSYYCPNCLFEVPSASVRAEKNRCARNCFQCPCCTNTLAVVPTDPTDPNAIATPSSAQASIGEPPYYLSCLACRWDSKTVGITFDKPTGLAAQLQKFEDSLPSATEYDSIREHLEPWLKTGLSAEHSEARAREKHHGSHRNPTSAIAAAARALSHSNSTMSRDIPSSIASASRFNSLHNLAAMHRSNSFRSGLSKTDPSAEATSKDELVPYKSKNKEYPSPADTELVKVTAAKSTPRIDDTAKLDQRWLVSAQQPSVKKDLRPSRIPLQSKRTKRCPACRHIVVKPDTKAASTRYKIRLVASSYLPQIDVHRRIPPALGSRMSAVGTAPPGSTSSSASRRGRVSATGAAPAAVETLIAVGSVQDVAEPLRPGRNFSFQLTFTNPLYEAIEVTLEVLEPIDDDEVNSDDGKEEINQADDSRTSAAPARIASKQPWTVSLPGTTFGINAFAEAWEYEGEDDDEDELGGPGDSLGGKKRKHGPGILAQKANKTVIQLDLAVGREASGEVRLPLYITYTYTAEDTLPAALKEKQARQAAEASKASEDATTPLSPSSNLKSFSFWANIPLGRVVPRVGAAGSTLTVDREARRMASSSSLR